MNEPHQSEMLLSLRARVVQLVAERLKYRIEFERALALVREHDSLQALDVIETSNKPATLHFFSWFRTGKRQRGVG
jgi:hypothetical protein